MAVEEQEQEQWEPLTSRDAGARTPTSRVGVGVGVAVGDAYSRLASPCGRRRRWWGSGIGNLGENPKTAMAPHASEVFAGSQVRAWYFLTRYSHVA